MSKHKNNYKSKNGRYYVLKGSNAVMIAYNWDQANECFQKYLSIMLQLFIIKIVILLMVKHGKLN